MIKNLRGKDTNRGTRARGAFRFILAIVLTFVFLFQGVGDIFHSGGGVLEVQAAIASGGMHQNMYWEISDSGVLTVRPSGGKSYGRWVDNRYTNGTVAGGWPWKAHADKITEVKIQGTIGSSPDTDLKNMFSDLPNVTKIDISGFNFGTNADGSQGDSTRHTIRNLDNMFSNCPSLTEIVGLDVLAHSSVTSTNEMFKGCTSLTTADFNALDMTNVQTAKGMFQNCSSLTELDLSNWTNNGKMYQMQDFANGCTSLKKFTLNNAGFETRVVKSATNASKYKNTTSVTGCQSQRMFDGCSALEELDLSNITISTWRDPYYVPAPGETDEQNTFVRSIGGEHSNGLPNLRVLNMTNIKLPGLKAGVLGGELIRGKRDNLEEFYFGGDIDIDDAINDTTHDPAYDSGLEEIVDKLIENCNSLRVVDLSGWDTSELSEQGEVNGDGKMEYTTFGFRDLPALEKLIAEGDSRIWMHYQEPESSDSTISDYDISDDVTPEELEKLYIDWDFNFNNATDDAGNEYVDLDSNENDAKTLRAVIGGEGGQGNLAPGTYIRTAPEPVKPWVDENGNSKIPKTYYLVNNFEGATPTLYYKPDGGDYTLVEDAGDYGDYHIEPDGTYGGYRIFSKMFPISQGANGEKTWDQIQANGGKLDDNVKLKIVYPRAATDVNGKLHDVVIDIDSVTFKDMDLIPTLRKENDEYVYKVEPYGVNPWGTGVQTNDKGETYNFNRTDQKRLVGTNPSTGEFDGTQKYTRELVAALNSRVDFWNQIYTSFDSGRATNPDMKKLSKGSGTYIDYRISVDDALPDTSVLYWVGDLDVAHSQVWDMDTQYADNDKMTSDAYGPGAEGIVLRSGNDLSTLTLANTTGLKRYQYDNTDYNNSQPNDNGNYIVGSATDPDTSWSRFYLRADSQSSSYTWTSGISCKTTIMRNTPLEHDMLPQVYVIPEAAKTVNGTTPAGEYKNSFTFNIERAEEIEHVPYTYFYMNENMGENPTPVPATVQLPNAVPAEYFQTVNNDAGVIPLPVQSYYAPGSMYEQDKYDHPYNEHLAKAYIYRITEVIPNNSESEVMEYNKEKAIHYLQVIVSDPKTDLEMHKGSRVDVLTGTYYYTDADPLPRKYDDINWDETPKTIWSQDAVLAGTDIDTGEVLGSAAYPLDPTIEYQRTTPEGYLCYRNEFGSTYNYCYQDHYGQWWNAFGEKVDASHVNQNSPIMLTSNSLLGKKVYKDASDNSYYYDGQAIFRYVNSSVFRIAYTPQGKQAAGNNPVFTDATGKEFYRSGGEYVSASGDQPMNVADYEQTPTRVEYDANGDGEPETYTVKVDANGTKYVKVPKYEGSTDTGKFLYLDPETLDSTQPLQVADGDTVFPTADDQVAAQKRQAKVGDAEYDVQIDVHGKAYVLADGKYYAVTLKDDGTAEVGDELTVEDASFNPDTSDRFAYKGKTVEYNGNTYTVKTDALGTEYFEVPGAAGAASTYRSPDGEKKKLNPGSGQVSPSSTDKDVEDPFDRRYVGKIGSTEYPCPSGDQALDGLNIYRDTAGELYYVVGGTTYKYDPSAQTIDDRTPYTPNGKAFVVNGHTIYETQSGNRVKYYIENGEYYSVLGTLLTTGTNFSPADDDPVVTGGYDIRQDENGKLFYKGEGTYRPDGTYEPVYYELKRNADGSYNTVGEYTVPSTILDTSEAINVGSFENTAKVSEIEIENKAEDDKAGIFTFEIEFDSDFEPTNVVFNEVTPLDGDGKISPQFEKIGDGKYKFTLTEGQKVTIKNVPFQTTYTVTKLPQKNGWELVSADADTQASSITKTITQERYLDDGTENPDWDNTHTFVNRFTELVVKKVVPYNEGSQEDTFSFKAIAKITGLDPNESFSYGYMDEDNNKKFKTAKANADGEADIALDDFTLQSNISLDEEGAEYTSGKNDIVLVLPRGNAGEDGKAKVDVIVTEIPTDGYAATWKLEKANESSSTGKEDVDENGATDPIPMTEDRQVLTFENISDRTNLVVQKIWVDEDADNTVVGDTQNKDKLRPDSVTLTVTATVQKTATEYEPANVFTDENGKTNTKEVILTSADAVKDPDKISGEKTDKIWKIVEDLPRYYDNKPVKYTVTEKDDDVPANYTKSLEINFGHVHQIVNTYKRVSFTGTKIWKDGGKVHNNSAELKDKLVLHRDWTEKVQTTVKIGDGDEAVTYLQYNKKSSVTEPGGLPNAVFKKATEDGTAEKIYKRNETSGEMEEITGGELTTLKFSTNYEAATKDEEKTEVVENRGDTKYHLDWSTTNTPDDTFKIIGLPAGGSNQFGDYEYIYWVSEADSALPADSDYVVEYSTDKQHTSTVDEKEVTVVDGILDGGTITNRLKDKVEFSANKEWVDTPAGPAKTHDNARELAEKLALYRNNEKLEKITVPVLDGEGNPTYEEGSTTPKTAEYDVAFKWGDNENANTFEVGYYTGEGDSQAWNKLQLDKYDENGNLYTYTVKEAPVSNYLPPVYVDNEGEPLTDGVTNGGTIRNIEPQIGEVTISARKVLTGATTLLSDWADATSKDTPFKFDLKAPNGKVIQTVTVKADGNSKEAETVTVNGTEVIASTKTEKFDKLYVKAFVESGDEVAIYLVNEQGEMIKDVGGNDYVKLGELDADGKLTAAFTVAEQKLTDDAAQAGLTQPDAATINITVSVERDGTLAVMTDAEDNTVDLVNEHTGEVESKVTLQKTLTGRDLNKNDFSYTITYVDPESGTDEEKARLREGLVTPGADDYTIKVDQLDVASDKKIGTKDVKFEFSKTGTYNFKATEDIPGEAVAYKTNASGELVKAEIQYKDCAESKRAEYTWVYNGVVYDGEAKDIRIKVEKAANGELKATVAEPTNSAAEGEAEKHVVNFTNSYTAEGTADIPVTKIVQGITGWDRDMIFNFDIEKLSVTTGTDTAATTDDVEITASETDEDKKALFEGMPMPSEDILRLGYEDAQGETSATGHWAIAFKSEHAGNTYSYVITERTPGWDGYEAADWTIDQTKYRVDVKVSESDAHDGKLTLTYTYKKAESGDNWANASGISFTNTRKSDTVNLAAGKTVKAAGNYDGDYWKNGSTYTIKLSAQTSDTPMPSGEGADTVTATKANPTSTFGSITFDEQVDAIRQLSAGGSIIYIYDIEEEIPEDAVDNVKDGITYDTETYHAYVTVTKDESGNLLNPVVTYDTNGDEMSDGTTPPIFTNTYHTEGEIELTAKKTLAGANLTDYEDSSKPGYTKFTVSLYEADGTTLVSAKDTETYPEGIKNIPVKTNGSITLPTIAYDEQDVDVVNTANHRDKTYYLKEDNLSTDINGVTRDETAYRITVRLKDDGKGKITATVVDTNGTTQTTPCATIANVYSASAEQQFQVYKHLKGRTISREGFAFTLTGMGVANVGDGEDQISYTDSATLAGKLNSLSGIDTALKSDTTAPVGKPDATGESVETARALPQTANYSHEEDASFETITYTTADLANLDTSGGVTSYDTERTFVYEIAEVEPEGEAKQLGIAYDKTKYYAFVKITNDTAAGDLKTAVVYVKYDDKADAGSKFSKYEPVDWRDGDTREDQTTYKDEIVDVDFTNNYNADGSINIAPIKQILGRSWQDIDEFEFIIEPYQSGTNTGDVYSFIGDHTNKKPVVTENVPLPGNMIDSEDRSKDGNADGVTSVTGKATNGAQDVGNGERFASKSAGNPEGFDDIKFSESMLTYDSMDGRLKGTYFYKITENTEKMPEGFIQTPGSRTEFYAMVSVVGDRAGNLETSVAYFSDTLDEDGNVVKSALDKMKAAVNRGDMSGQDYATPVFQNTYDAQGYVWAHVIKYIANRNFKDASLDGSEIKGDAFSFTVEGLLGSKMDPTGVTGGSFDDATKVFTSKPINYEDNGVKIGYSESTTDDSGIYAAKPGDSNKMAVEVGESAIELSDLTVGADGIARGSFLFALKEPAGTTYDGIKVNKVEDLNYDARTIYMKVDVEDNLDGTLQITPSYWLDPTCKTKLTDENGRTPQVWIYSENPLEGKVRGRVVREEDAIAAAETEAAGIKENEEAVKTARNAVETAQRAFDQASPDDETYAQLEQALKTAKADLLSAEAALRKAEREAKYKLVPTAFFENTEKVNIEVTKKWVDGKDKPAEPTEAVTVALWRYPVYVDADGKYYTDAELTEEYEIPADPAVIEDQWQPVDTHTYDRGDFYLYSVEGTDQKYMKQEIEAAIAAARAFISTTTDEDAKAAAEANIQRFERAYKNSAAWELSGDASAAYAFANLERYERNASGDLTGKEYLFYVTEITGSESYDSVVEPGTDKFTITNKLKATNVANIAAVKQITGRDWNGADSEKADAYKFKLEPLGKGAYYTEGDVIPGKQVGDLKTDANGVVYVKNGSNVDTDIPTPADNTGATTGKDSTTVVTNADPKVTQGERLARFNAISYQVSDLTYDAADGHMQGDFFYKMTEVIPVDAKATEDVEVEVNGSTETIAQGTKWSDVPEATKTAYLEQINKAAAASEASERAVTVPTVFMKDQVWYSGKISTVHVKVRENRTDSLTVQVAYNETTPGDISTGTQFTPVYTNRYTPKTRSVWVHKVWDGVANTDVTVYLERKLEKDNADWERVAGATTEFARTDTGDNLYYEFKDLPAITKDGIEIIYRVNEEIAKDADGKDLFEISYVEHEDAADGKPAVESTRTTEDGAGTVVMKPDTDEIDAAKSNPLVVTNTSKYESGGTSHVNVVKQFVGKDWEDETFTFKITPIESKLGVERDEGTWKAYHKDTNPMPLPATKDVVKDTATASAQTMEVSVNEHSALFDPITYTVGDLEVDPSDGIAKGDFKYKVTEVLPEETATLKKVFYTYSYKEGEETKTDTITAAAYDASGLPDDKQDAALVSVTYSNNITYSLEEHEVIIHAQDDGKGNIHTTKNWDGRDAGTFVPVFTNSFDGTVVRIRKIWTGDDAKNRPDAVSYKITASVPGSAQDAAKIFTEAGAIDLIGGTTNVVTKTISASEIADAEVTAAGTAWSKVFDLPATGKDGQKLTYAVEEIVPSGYYLMNQVRAGNYYTFVNVVSPTISITGTKQWLDGGKAHNNSKDVTLVVKRTAVQDPTADDWADPQKTTTLTKGTDYQVEWITANENGDTFRITGLTKYADANKEYRYQVTEAPVEGYTTTYQATGADAVGEELLTETGGKIINTIAQQEAQVQVTKKWIGDPTEDVVVELKLDGAVIASHTIKKEEIKNGEATYTFEKGKDNLTTLPKYNVGNAGNKNGDAYKNDGSPVEYTVTERAGETFDASITGDTQSGFVITNKVRGADVTEVTINKVWSDNNNHDGKRPADDEVEVTLSAKSEKGTAWDGKDQSGKDVSTVKLNRSNNGVARIENLPATDNTGSPYTYTVKEVVPEGYKASYKSTVGDAEKTDGTVGDDGTITITNTAEDAVITVEASKKWTGEPEKVGDSMRPEKVTLHLYGMNGDEIVYDAGAREIKSDSEDPVKWEDLPKYHYSDQAMTWTIVEDAVFGYKALYSQETDDKGNVTFAVTNAYVTPVNTIRVTKTWNDDGNADGVRPTEIRYQLWKKVGADGTAVKVGGPVKAVEDAPETGEGPNKDWGYTWTELPTVSTETEEREAEQTVMEDYEEPVTSEITPAGQDESVTMYAFRAADVEETYYNTNADGTGSWYHADGTEAEALTDPTAVTETKTREKAQTETVKVDVEKPIYYSVTEEAVEGYTSVIATTEDPGVFEAVNTHERKTQDITVRKVWADSDDKDGKRPDHITFTLEGDGKTKIHGDATKITGIVISEENDWTVKLHGLPVYQDGKVKEAIKYTVKEEQIPDGYTAAPTGSETEGFTITNTYNASADLTLKATKVWVDTGDPARRDIILHLIRVVDGARKDLGQTFEKTIKADAEGAGLTATWTDLPAFVNGKAATYTVEEWSKDDNNKDVRGVPGYTTDQSNGETEGTTISITITNTRNGRISITYKDAEEFGGTTLLGPERITAGDKEPDAPGVPDDADHSAYTFTGWKRTTDENGNVIYIATYKKNDTPDPGPGPDPQPTAEYKVTYVDPMAEEGKMLLVAEKCDDPENDAKGLAPEDPAHEGYTFTGWVVNVDKYGDYVYVAKYTEPAVTDSTKVVSYIDPQSGKLLVSEITDDASTVKEPAAPTAKNMQFKGWKEVKDANGNIIFVAQYEADCKNGTSGGSSGSTSGRTTGGTTSRTASGGNTTTITGWGKSAPPNTGDPSQILLYLGSIGSAVTVAATAVAKRRRNRRRR